MTEHVPDDGQTMPEAPDPEAFSRTGGPAELERILEAFDRLPVHRHAEVYDRLHAALRQRLDAEAGPHAGRGTGPRP